jgi:hypothetical protein
MLMDDPTPEPTQMRGIGAFGMIPEWLLLADVTSTAKVLFGWMACRYANRSTWACWPGQARLAADLNMSTATIARAIDELVTIGALSKRARLDASGAPTSNFYQLMFLDPSPQKCGDPSKMQGPLPSKMRGPLPSKMSDKREVLEPEVLEREEEGLGRPAAATTRPQPLIDSPLQWHRRHGSHVQELCDWVCLPQELAGQYATRAGLTDAEVLAWAKQVRQDWQTAKRVPTGSMFDFWQARWAERVAASQPTAVPPGHTFSDLTQYRKDRDERERKEAERIARYHEETRRQMAYLRALEEEMRNEQQ